MKMSSKGTTKRPNNMTLHMECYSEDLSPVQIDRRNKAKQKKTELKEVVENWRRSEGDLVTRISDDCFVLERLCTPLQPKSHVSKPVASVDVAPSIISEQPIMLQPRNVSSLVSHQPVMLPNPINKHQTSVRGQTTNSVITQPCGLLVRDTRRTRVMGVVSGSQPTSLAPHMVTTAPSMPKAVPLSSVAVPSLQVSSPMQAPGVIMNRNISLQSNNILQSPTIRPVNTVGIVLQSTNSAPSRYPAPVRVPLSENASASRPVNTTSGGIVTQHTPSIRVAHYGPRQSPVRSPRIPQTSPTLRSRSHVALVRNVRPMMPAPRVTVPARSLMVQPVTVGRPPGVPANKNPSRLPNNPQVPPPNSASGAPVVDLTCDDSPSEIPADTREITFNKLIGKTFPSLVVTARPSIRVKEVTAVQLSEDRTELDKKVKKVLMFTPTKFSEWMIQEGLVRSDQYCQTHVTPYGEKIPLKLGIYSDVSKFPFSGGYVWISDCCPQRFVSVFSGSIFEGSPHPPTVLVKLIYHWVVQTSIQNVIQWVKVDNLYVKGFYTHLRSICTAAVAEKFSRMGGPNKKIEIGVVSLGITAHGGKSRNVKVEVLGIMDPVNKIVRLQAVEPIKMGDPDYQSRFIKLLNPVKEWVDKDSIILTDYTVDKPTLQAIGFKTIYQVPAGEEQTAQNKYSNHNVMNYLRNNVPKMFQNTLSLLSRQIIQQFLDELVWREQWGYTPYKGFHNMLTHMAEQVKLDSNESLLTRLSKIASDPFKCWTYSVLKTPPFTPAGVQFPAKLKDSEIQQSASQIPGDASTPPAVSGIDLLPQSIRETGPTDPAKPLKSVKKRSSASVESSDTKRIAIDSASQPATPTLSAKKRPNTSVESSDSKRIAVDSASQPVTLPLPEEMVQLETFYYGQLPGEKHILEMEHKDTDGIVCQSCYQTFPNNTELLQHLICHAQPNGKDLPEININLQCRYCLKFFASQYALQVHLEEIHFNNSTSLVCRICERKFRTRVTLISHMHTTHFQLEMPYECGICKFRSSLHKDVVNHFHETHINTMKLQCPFCLKVVALSKTKQILAQNIFFFINHLQKHQRKSLCMKCSTCVLWFAHKDILKEHQTRDHRSFCGRQDEVIPFMNITGFDIMMPKPPPAATKPCQMISISKNVFTSSPNSKSLYTSKSFTDLKIVCVDEDALCNECEGRVLEDNHFATEISCACCSYATCCTKAMMDHVLIFHQDSIKNRSQFNMGRVSRLEKPMYCVCGFTSSSGNCLARHLALCDEKTAYPEPYCPKIVELSSASFPPLVTLDDTDNVSEDPSDRWLKAFVPPRKDDSDNSRSAPDKKLLEPQEKFTEHSEPPSVLNILGLMQKPSSDVTVVNSSAPNSPKVDDKQFPDQEERETDPS
ncbi:uncharacterized protein LOC126162254 [Schistocerca cancellata]|uniref:uncharacterized protein LOC126162254 n=1 Tax=Schistocerca cancellata TaxID=274614 RepID=UPI002119446C|nr:uncharacterized protein LOC126162254 [Schistocerca cancellata]